MPATIRILGMYTKVTEGRSVDTTSRSGLWSGLSPFVLGPCPLYGERTSETHENTWQYAKVYECHADSNGDPTPDYWRWAEAGWANPKAVRYPMGRGAVPLHSLWDGKKLNYIEARKAIYAPLYSQAVRNTEAYAALQNLYETEELLVLRDYDGYDHTKLGMSLTDVLNYSRKKMGHAFVLATMLTGDAAMSHWG